MPVIFGTSVSAATYDSASGNVTADGEAFADTEYSGVSKIEVSPAGENSWSAANSIVSWSDTQVIGKYTSGLSAGTYDVRVTSSDGEVATLSDAFIVSASTANGDLFFFYKGSKS